MTIGFVSNPLGLLIDDLGDSGFFLGVRPSGKGEGYTGRERCTRRCGLGNGWIESSI